MPDINVQQRKKRILIADDSDLIRQSLARMIGTMPHLELVGELGDGLEACDAVRALNPDVAVLDIHLPEMNGIEVLRKIRSEGYLGTVIMLAGNLTEEHRDACRKALAKHVFEKATDATSFLQALRDL